MRQIRTSGKGSGSIELTLPAGLRDLVGVPCRVILRDGSRPDIVLQPDLRGAHHAFTALWHAMLSALLPGDGAGTTLPAALPVGAFAFGLQPRLASGELPHLCWRDGLALAGAPPHEPVAISRTLTAFGQALAGRLRIDPVLAVGFGAACGYLASGVVASADGQEVCDLVAAALFDGHRNAGDKTAGDPGSVHRYPAVAGAGPPPSWGPYAAACAAPSTGPSAAASAACTEVCAAGAMSDAFWRRAEPVLTATADLFLAWTRDPTSYATLRTAWWRGRIAETSGD